MTEINSQLLPIMNANAEFISTKIHDHQKLKEVTELLLNKFIENPEKADMLEHFAYFILIRFIQLR